MMRALMLCLICSWLAGCAVNPATGRNDFVMMSERQGSGSGPCGP